MRRVHYTVRNSIFKILDIFYPLFRRLMPLQTYHYAACGGVTTFVNLLVYFISYNYIFHKQVWDLGFIAFKPHIAALFVAFIVALPIGFYLSMYVTFQGSYLKRRVQFFRYFVVLIGCMIIDYVGLKILVERVGFYPTPSKLITTSLVIIFNYFSQRHFSFRKEKKMVAAESVNV